MYNHFDVEDRPVVGYWKYQGGPTDCQVTTNSEHFARLFQDGADDVTLTFCIDYKPYTLKDRPISMHVSGNYLNFKLPQGQVKGDQRGVNFARQLMQDRLWPDRLQPGHQVHHSLTILGQIWKSDNCLDTLVALSPQDHLAITTREMEEEKQWMAVLEAAPPSLFH